MDRRALAPLYAGPVRIVCLVLLPIGLLGLVDVLLLDQPSSHGWWQHDGGVLVLSVAATLIGLGALIRRRPHRGEPMDEPKQR